MSAPRAHKRDDKDRKSLPECDDKAFKPCHLHRPKSQHTFKKCFKNPKNQDKKSYSYHEKHAHEAHHYNECHASKDKESRTSVDLPAPSNSHLSPSEDKQQDEDKQYHVHFEKKVKVGSQVAPLPCKKKNIKSTVSTTLKKTPPTFLDNDLDLGNNFKDRVLMGLESLMDADLKGFDDIMNPFDFK